MPPGATSPSRSQVARPPSVARALRFVLDPGGDRFEDTARDVFVYQVAACPPYRRFCERRGVHPDSVARWEEIPAVPTAAFRAAVLATAPPAHVFATSGTSHGESARGRHHLPELDLYAASWVEPFRRHVLPDLPSIRILSLVPSWSAAPESSLAYMISAAMERFGAPGSGTFLHPGGLDREGFARVLHDARRRGEPVLIAGTLFALAGILDALDATGERIPLPAGSRIMDTGGMKGRRREVARAGLLDRYRDRLGVPETHVVGEYGMTELSSQFYETPLADEHAGRAPSPVRRWVGPPWTRTRAFDPETLRPLEDGRPGLLAHWDLANAWTALAVLTEDMGVTRGDSFELLGRAEGAALRGCSLAAEEILDGA